MQLLQAVNEILPALGEHTVTAVDERHPTVAVILNAIYSETDVFLLKGWWFNMYTITLRPDPERAIFLPQDTLEVLGLDQPCIQRGDQAWNPINFSYLWDGPVKVRLKSRLDFEHIPESAARAVLYRACIKAYETDIGLEKVINEWKLREAEALQLVLAEHLRNARYSTTRTNAFQRIRRALRG